jgi:hypothetical protein
MHDGYLFSLGICGTASDASRAPALLNAMLAAIPPVKRAALLGDVRRMDDPANIDGDGLLDEVAADFADAELLLLATPAVAGDVSPRMAALLAMAAHEVRANLPKHAVLLATDEEGDETAALALERLVAWCAQCGVIVSAQLAISLAIDDEHALGLAHAAAQTAYEATSETLRSLGVEHLR